MGEKDDRRQPDPQLDSDVARLYERFLRETDFAAIEKIVELCAPELFKVAFAVVRQEESARDVVQEAFKEFARYYGKIAKKGSVRAWLRRVAVRKALRERKRQGKFPLPLELIEEIADPGKTPVENLLSKEAGETLARAIQQLPKQQRAAMELHLKEVDAPQAAAILGVSVSTYRSNLWRAMNHLKKIMEDSP
jgi:RNA polymerase sigma-70 factor (ECF subfamily)